MYLQIINKDNVFENIFQNYVRRSFVECEL